MRRDKTELITERLESLLPDKSERSGINNQDLSHITAEAVETIKAKQNAKEIARLKYSEKAKLKRMEEKESKLKAITDELGVDNVPSSAQTEKQARALAEQRIKVRAIEAIEAETAEPFSIPELQKKGISASRALQLQGTTRPEIAKLLTNLNINLSVQLTKTDTANLLACLLTCNETQLDALYENKKVPLAIKAVIKRLQNDATLGNIDTIERLWDRVFGKGQMLLDLPSGQQLETGIIPNTPVSREAYIVIRDTLMK